MLTFLELYQTLLGFVFFKLYSENNLVYPPKFDIKSDDEAAGIGSLLLEETSRTLTIQGRKGTEGALGSEKKVTAKDVKKQIRSLAQQEASSSVQEGQQMQSDDKEMSAEPSTRLLAEIGDVADFPKPLDGLNDSAMQPEEDISNIFKGYFFYLSREVTRPTLEFVIRSFGGQVGWDAILGAGSPLTLNDPRITHHVIDRPIPVSSDVDGTFTGPTSSSALVLSDLPGKRAYIQPQWVVDCINLCKLLPTDLYAPGKILPPHLSPFVDVRDVRAQGGYIPLEAASEAAVEGEGETGEKSTMSEEEEVEEETEDTSAEVSHHVGVTVTATKRASQPGPALIAAAANPGDALLSHAAELEAEARGIPYSRFQTSLAALQKRSSKEVKEASRVIPSAASVQEQIPASILLSNKQRKLFNKMKYGENRRKEEADKLQEKKNAVDRMERKGKMTKV